MKHLRKCDGYVLPYVLVVFLILSAVAVSICTTSLNNLKAQEAAVKRSQALYEAEGEVEKFVVMMTKAAEGEKEESFKSTRADALSSFWNKVEGGEILKSPASLTSETFLLTLQAKNGDAIVEARIKVALRMQSQEEVRDNGELDYDYRVAGISSLIYESYDISYTGGDAG